jgi:CNT family concentrative nucleoside transporter
MVIIALGWALSENRRAFSVRLVASALVLQAAIAILLLKLPPARQALLGSIRW